MNYSEICHILDKAKLNQDEFYEGVRELSLLYAKQHQVLTNIKCIVEQNTKLKMYDPDFDLILQEINKLEEDTNGI